MSVQFGQHLRSGRIRWAVALMVASLAAALAVAAARPAAGDSTTVVGVPSHGSVVAAMKRAADYYQPNVQHTSKVGNGWSWSTYFQGLLALYGTAGDQKYLTDARSWGQQTGWTLTTAEADPDSAKAAQPYYALHQLDPHVPLSTVDARLAADLVDQPASAYWWADALFMGLPNWPLWATRTGNAAYLTKLDEVYAWTRDQANAHCPGAPPGGLYDADEHLWLRDCTFIDKVEPNGKKVFWGRGNGWVMAAMAQTLANLPATEQAHAAPYRTMLQSMAERIKDLQGPDGFWRSSLLDPDAYPQPETSGTALFTYALAYGIDAGLLDRATYLPVVVRAWNGLAGKALQGSGFVSDCQAPAGGPGQPYTGTAPRTRPTATSAGTLLADSPLFCVGAFLLAGSEVARLSPSLSTGRQVTASAAQPGNGPARAVDGNVTTYWAAKGFPQSLVVDLGTARAIGNTMVVPYLDRPYRYRIDTSADARHWRLVVSRTGNTVGGSNVATLPAPVSARYVRLTVTGQSGPSTGWVGIQEFGVYPAASAARPKFS